MADKIFADGMMWQDPNEKAPDFIKGEILFQTEKFVDFIKANMEYTTPKGWMKVVMKEAKGSGKIYFELDTWKPTQKETPINSMTSVQPDGSEPLDTEEIPF